MKFLGIIIVCTSIQMLDATVKKVFDPCQVTFEAHVFAPALTRSGTPVLFLGASSVTNPTTGTPYILSRLLLQRASCVAPQATIQSLTPAQVLLNGATTLSASPIGTESPTLTTLIPHLSLLNYQYPVFTAQDVTLNAGTFTPANQSDKVFVLTDPLAGSSMLRSEALPDANANSQTTGGIVGIQGSDRNLIFAAVSEHNMTFAHGGDRGIAVVQRSTVDGVDTLAGVEASNFSAGPGPAARIDTLAQTDLIGFNDSATPSSITQVLLDSRVDMAWSGTLQRLYVGLSNVRRDDPANSGGGLGGFIGRVNRSQPTPYPCGPTIESFVLDPLVVEPKKVLFFNGSNQNTNKVPFGFYFDSTLMASSDGTIKNDGTSVVSISMQNLAVMHTSTNKPYLIFNSISSLPPTVVLNTMFFNGYNTIYAVPLIPTELNGYPNVKGTVAQVDADGIPVVDINGFYRAPTALDNMPNINQDPVRVGGFFPVSGTNVQDLFVDGDAVYITLAGPNNAHQGMYKSSALFNENGLIRGWTPFDRVMGSIQKVVGAGLDNYSGDFYFLSNSLTPTSANVVNTGQISVWGKGDTTFHGGTTDGLLSSVLEKIFPQNLGGVHQIFNFDEFTPGFTLGRFSMMVAVGFGRIALIQTGSYSAGQFTPTQQFQLNTNVFVLADSVLAELGPICCAGIGLTNADENTGNSDGYLYVGGFGGVARIGSWPVIGLVNGLQSLSTSNAPGMFPGTLTFAKIASDITGPVYNIALINDIIDLNVSKTDGELFIITGDKVYRRQLDGMSDGSMPLPVVNGADLVLADDIPFVASSQGIQFANPNFTQLTAVAGISGHAVQLQYVSQERDGVSSTPGNIYALVLGQRIPETPQESNQCVQPIVPQVWRIAVNDDASAATVIDKQKIPANNNLPGPFVQYDKRRSMSYTDGSLLLSMQPKEVTGTDFVRLLSLVTTPTNQTSRQRLTQESSITGDLNLDFCTAFNVGLPTRDSSHGAWVLPGDWGVRLND